MEKNQTQMRKRGGQPGNKNALKHGFFTREKLEERRRMNEVIKQQWQKMLSEIEQTAFELGYTQPQKCNNKDHSNVYNN